MAAVADYYAIVSTEAIATNGGINRYQTHSQERDGVWQMPQLPQQYQSTNKDFHGINNEERNKWQRQPLEEIASNGGITFYQTHSQERDGLRQVPQLPKRYPL